MDMARKNAAAVALGKRRMKLISAEERAELGRKGGQAKVPKGLASLSPKRRKEIARKAAETRWGKKPGEKERP
jgi:hypothetical protein